MRKCSFFFIFLALLFISPTAYAYQWVQTSAPSASWSALSASSNASRLAGTTNYDGIFISNNSGNIWTKTTQPNNYWSSITSSENGLKVAAVGTHGVVTSTDGGVNWTTTSAPQASYSSITSSIDGTKLFAATTEAYVSYPQGHIYTSFDSGTNWQQSSAPAGGWSAISASSNGSKLVATVYQGFIWLSQNSGTTWTQSNAPSGLWSGIASSADGSKIVATLTCSDSVYVSLDSGVSWQAHFLGVGAEGCQTINSVTMSADGTKIAAADYSNPGAVYMSIDSGVTWRKYGPAGNIYPFAITASYDGNTIFMGENNGRVFTFTYSDLTAGSIIPTAVVDGNPINLSASITNQGGGSTVDGFSYFFQLSIRDSGGNGANINLSPGTTNLLTPGQGRYVSSTYPGNFQSGYTYSARVCADASSPMSSYGGNIIESNEQNNCGPWTSIIVGSGGGVLPDLTAGAATPTSVNQLGAPTLFSAQINNTTASSVGGFNYFFQLASAANGGGSITDLAASSTQLSPPATDATLPPATGYLYVGPARTYTKPSQAFAAAQDGNYILIDAGTYTDDFATINANNLVIKSVGGKARIVQSSGATNPNGKGLWVTAGSNITIDGIEFVGSHTAALNGAGVRAEGAGLTLRNSYFHNNQDGILSIDNISSDILIESSEFANNGDTGNAYQYNIAVGEVRTFTFRYNYNHDAVGGELLRSTAHKNVIIYNRFVGSSDASANNTTSYIDFPFGGDCFVVGNIFYAPLATNPLIFAGEVTQSNPSQQLSIVNNTFVSPQTIYFFSAVPNSYAKNDLFVGDGSPLYYGTGVVTGSISSNPSGNLFFALSSFTGFVDKANYDFRLSSGSSAIDQGVVVSPVNGTSLVPTDHYQNNLSHQTRTTIGPAIDVGAYEYGADFQSVTATTNITFSFTGTYSTRVCADKSSTGDPGIITESDETNNCGPWTNVTVTNTNPTGTISASPCTLQGGSCMVYLAFNAITLGGNRTYVKQTDPDGIVSTIYSVTGMDSVSAPSLGVSATKVGSYLYQLYIDNPSATLLASTTTLVYTPPTLLCNGQTSCATDIGGTPVTLTWNCPESGASSVGSAFATLGAQSGSRSVAPIATTTYGIQCNPPGNTAQVTVSVATPMLQIDVPSHVRKNATTTLSWNATHVSSCTLSGKGVLQTILSGSLTTPPITGLTVYTLACATNSGVVSIVRTIRMVPVFKEP